MGKLYDKYHLSQKFGDLAWDDNQDLLGAYDTKHDLDLSKRRANLLRDTLSGWRAVLLNVKKIAESQK